METSANNSLENSALHAVPYKLEDILSTDKLLRRPSKSPNFEAENKAILMLAYELANSPRTVLQKLVDAALTLTGAGSSGISIEENNDNNRIFRWHATAGEFMRYVGGTMPRDFSPCGAVLDRNATLLMSDAVRFYSYIADLHLPCHEILLVPFYRGGKPIGTIWIVAHDAEKRFDQEDKRIITSLATFAAMATKSLVDLDKLEATNRTLEEARVRLEDALQAGAIGTWTWIVGSNEIITDHHLNEMFGSPFKNQAVPLATYMKAIHPEDRERVSLRLKSVLSNPQSYEAEYRTLHPDGSVRWIIARGVPMVDANGVLRQFTGVVFDNTARKINEIRDLEENRRRSEFLAILAHELRNPLAPIRNAVEIMKYKSLDADMISIRDMMERQINQMTALIDDLMDVTRISTGKVTLQKTVTDIRASIENAVETCSLQIKATNHQLLIELPSKAVLVNGDSVRLSQVFSNILTNAAKYTPAGGNIKISLKAKDGVAVTTIADDGIGIAPEKLKSIFQMFGQVDHTADLSGGGLGIGLALTKTFIELHGGTIEARSAGLTKGSQFIVRLAVSTEEQQTSSQTCHNIQAPNRKRILIADDNIDSAESMAVLLNISGHEVTLVHNGADAIEVATKIIPDIILLDIGMPGMDGYEVAKAIRSNPRFSNVELIAMTGWGTTKDKVIAKDAGFNHHLTKPIDFDELTKLFAALATNE